MLTIQLALALQSVISLCSYQIRLLANFHKDTTRSLKCFWTFYINFAFILCCVLFQIFIALLLRTGNTRSDMWSHLAMTPRQSYRQIPQRYDHIFRHFIPGSLFYTVMTVCISVGRVTRLLARWSGSPDSIGDEGTRFPFFIWSITILWFNYPPIHRAL